MSKVDTLLGVFEVMLNYSIKKSIYIYNGHGRKKTGWLYTHLMESK